VVLGVALPRTLGDVGAAEGEISGWIDEWARRSPDTIAIHCEDEAITYAVLEQRVARLAGALTGRAGIAAGDRVAYLGPNTPVLLCLLFACARVGAILVPLSARMPAAELAVVLANTEPGTLVAEAGLAEAAREAAGRLELRVIPFGGDEDATGELPGLPAGARNCPATPIGRRGHRWRSSTRRGPRGRPRARC